MLIHNAYKLQLAEQMQEKVEEVKEEENAARQKCTLVAHRPTSTHQTAQRLTATRGEALHLAVFEFCVSRSAFAFGALWAGLSVWFIDIFSNSVNRYFA